ncbi:gfo/Idh/MocA family oxidoreductase [Deinococcus koreensis]|uniref:Gfo/Idh/MocA family oxidoreductase n=2 Tax=Deinococcus koreensis TaxID=2054903 RepID=A0A2K3URR1_9DEIO|nr:gfo/Idh/MocA family oxidoreductase [Deinococcus koreensis]
MPTALILGAGFMAGAHLDALRRLGIPVAGVIASAPEHTRAVAQRYGVREYTDTWTALHDPAVTVVHDCAPSDVHMELNLAALKAGKHVFSEKPLGVTAQESRRQLDYALASGLKHGVHFTYRSYPMVRELRARVQRGELGEIRYLRGHYLQDWLLSPADYNWRLEASAEETRALGDIGSHLLDLARFVTGLEATEVFARLGQMHPTRYRPATPGQEGVPFDVRGEDQATLLVEYGQGVAATFEVAQVYAGHRNDLALEVIGTRGSARWQQERPEELWLGRATGPDELLHKSGLLCADARAHMHYPAGHPEGYADALTNAIRVFYAGLAGEATDAPTFVDGHAAALTVAAAARSHTERRWITVTELETPTHTQPAHSQGAPS